MAMIYELSDDILNFLMISIAQDWTTTFIISECQTDIQTMTDDEIRERCNQKWDMTSGDIQVVKDAIDAIVIRHSGSYDVASLSFMATPFEFYDDGV